ncbi:hypothetical protein P152DRAFT_244528 [Eremomyces bilateralis CBS 781.70]|uniref:MARVEL domain-containing protein n=1 Tax=Eremomyces bilateralis CBS 781.70 TaxID=1392243 RepID=A0A6G1GAN9_9PEZI|nr:uncharacterized protein P152DRAFT_244528 [Eremomyces bilateralis CBS 781.70]KAF1815072.1 hypothetical protein P152DRAFT_244528 [Eremomyces bilateralis CBS 781.70]
MLASLVDRPFQVCSLAITPVLALTRNLSSGPFLSSGLGPSRALIQDQWNNSSPAATKFAAFAGAFGLVVSLLGIVSVFVTALEGLITWVVDTLAGLFFLAAGVVFVVHLKTTNCDIHIAILAENPLLNGGCAVEQGEEYCWYMFAGEWSEEAAYGVLRDRCRMVQADTAFSFLACLTCVAALSLSFFFGRGGTRRGGAI